MTLYRLTITGADDSITPDDLSVLSLAYRFVEFGILLSKSREGTPRYPSRKWIERLNGNQCCLSGHVCGTWSRQPATLRSDMGVTIRGLFSRYQFNGIRAATQGFWEELTYLQPPQTDGKYRGLIFQWDGEDDNLFLQGRQHSLIVAPLFDLSGGTGKLPARWPTPKKVFSAIGYSGGLSPDNLRAQLPLIAAAAGPANYWVDMESGVRTGDRFDLERVRACLEIAEEFMRANP
jgi:hypothetical protein